MESDTREKKPKVYSVAAMTLIAAAGILLEIHRNEADSLRRINLILALYFLLSILILLDAFRKQLKYNPYSYNTIIYFGFGLFLFFPFMTHSYLAVKILFDQQLYNSHTMLSVLLNSSKNYLALTSPLPVIFAAGLVVSNLILIRIDGHCPANDLAILFAFAIAAGLFVIGIFSTTISPTDPNALWPNMLLNLGSAIYLYLECMMTGTITADVITAKYRPKPDKDFLIVLGAGLEKDGTPTRILAERLDLAFVFYTEQLQQTGKAASIITSGGQGSDEIRPESDSMCEYLVAKGIPAERIHQENKSANTAENMKYSKAVISAIQPDAKTAFFTSDFHVFRSGLEARSVKMNAVGMGAPTRWHFWPNAFVREFIGLLTGQRLKQALMLTAISLAYILMTVLFYLQSGG